MKRMINKIKEEVDDIEIVNVPNEKSKLETLHDFVDIEILILYKNSFNEWITKMKTIRDTIEPIIEKLLASINQKIFEVK